MNANHALCATPEWATHLHEEVLAPLLGGVELGTRLLEIGPGPGAATEWLRHRVGQLVAVELDQESAQRLAEKFPHTNVTVRIGDATCLDRAMFPDGSFDAVATFTMLHHIPTVAAQNQLLAEALRVLRPGGLLVGADSLASTGLHDFHDGDVYNPVEPAALLTRLLTLGFAEVSVAVSWDVRFTARKAAPEPPGESAS